MPNRLTVSPVESAQSLRPVTWRIWFAWLLVCALVPICSTISATALNKQVSRTAEYQTLIGYGLLALMAFATLAPPIMQGLVIKRVMPKLSVWLWCFCVLLSGIAWFMLMLFHDRGPALIEAGFQSERQLQHVALISRLAGTLNTASILALPWAPFLLWTIASSTLTSILPAWLLGTASGLRRATMLFVTASIVAACASAIVEQFYHVTGVDRVLPGWGLNGDSWTQRFQVLAARSGVGAVWGATAMIFVVPMHRRSRTAHAATASTFATDRVGGLALVMMAPLLIAVLAPFAGYLAGPRGIVAGAPELLRAMSLAPSHDRSTGEMVISYAHDVAVPVGRQPLAAMAPDGKSAIVRTADHTLVQVDLETGQSVRQLAAALAPLERHAVAWSPDGRTLALRSDGVEVPIPDTHYVEHRSRVRLYALPDLTLVGEFSHSEADCFDTYAREPMLFSEDSKSLWLVCGQHYGPKPDDIMAIQIDVPALQVHDIRRYGEGAENGATKGLERIRDSVWAWQFDTKGTAFRIYDLTHAREIANVRISTLLVGNMTAQTAIQVDDKIFRLNFCGAPPESPSDAGLASSICRILMFDTATGVLIDKVDRGDQRFVTSVPRSAMSGHGLRIESFWRSNSKTGELVVRDAATGRERQRIATMAQHPLQMSGDGAWLMTSAVFDGGLRLYRIHP